MCVSLRLRCALSGEPVHAGVLFLCDCTVQVFVCERVRACMYSVCVTETPVRMCAQVCLVMAPKWLSV